MPDFPSELVEAAAKALYEHFAFPHHGAIEQPWEEQTVEARETWYGQARAVLPRIEQRVIDRLAREAGEPPSDYPSMPHAACWKKGAAAGVAAERERTATVLREMADRVEADRREPDKILCHVLTARRAAADLIERGGE